MNKSGAQMNNDPRNTGCFSAESLRKLTGIMYEMKISYGTRLFWEYDKADKLYYIKKGSFRITKSSDDGRHFVLYLYKEGDLFGQVDPFRTLTQGFNAEVVEDSIVGVIQQRDLEILLWQHGELAIEFMKWMGLVHRMTQTKFRDLMMFEKTGALCSNYNQAC
ncbi:Crp/Fnr family transcriptional regulator [Paenibacillus gyeongsangnamensis]|uniref:Crp/Fnr family transcriptional regulator n=1 Tax=Paenibacillus gyeongsangnamensis TaxID=3388067 RepID=UPI002FCF37CE